MGETNNAYFSENDIPEGYVDTGELDPQTGMRVIEKRPPYKPNFPENACPTCNNKGYILEKPEMIRRTCPNPNCPFGNN